MVPKQQNRPKPEEFPMSALNAELTTSLQRRSEHLSEHRIRHYGIVTLRIFIRIELFISRCELRPLDESAESQESVTERIVASVIRVRDRSRMPRKRRVSVYESPAPKVDAQLYR